MIRFRSVVGQTLYFIICSGTSGETRNLLISSSVFLEVSAGLPFQLVLHRHTSMFISYFHLSIRGGTGAQGNTKQLVAYGKCSQDLLRITYTSLCVSSSVSVVLRPSQTFFSLPCFYIARSTDGEIAAS